MESAQKNKCQLCASFDVHLVFSERKEDRLYSSYECRSCGLHQTLGDIDPISPDYINLEEADLGEIHIYTQREHKYTAFKQWARMVKATRSGGMAGLKLLDIGCGVGGFLDFASKLGIECYGFDASGAQIEQAQKAFPNVRRAESVADYCDQIGGPREFDLITMWDVFEHIRTPDALLEEVSEHMAPDGLFYVSVPSGALNKIKVLFATIRNRENVGLIPWEHVFYYTPKSLALRLTRAGFHLVELSGVTPYQRKPLNMVEVIRRVMHHMLKHTPFAFQIYALSTHRGRMPSR